MRRKDPGATPPGACETALGLLSRREHSRRDLGRKLARRGVAAEDAQAAIDRLAGDAYQSDRRFAESLVRQRVGQGYGPRHVQAELGTHGIPSDTIRELLDEPDWDAVARDLVARRLRDPGDPDARRRAAGLLQRRGFGGDTIRRVLGRRPDGGETGD
ncbi:MAG: recombination regulator RecX [Xanthomonadaceae bacterium]|jgi:regulatory protein|nr:recombination regulator RecX [Xanthomonadaceae bacterium]